VAVAGLAAGALVVAAGCASEEAPTSATTAPETSSGTETGPAPELEPATGTDTTSEAVDPCALVSDETLADVFPAGAPEPDGTIYGAGFSDCTWDDAPDAFLAVSVVPGASFASDFVDQLNLGDPVTSDVLGPAAVSFLGTVGIGSASAGGATVGFVKDGTGALVAVRSGEEGGPGDLGTATTIAEEVAGGL
jgi:uncharacterized protein DUF3558